MGPARSTGQNIGKSVVGLKLVDATAGQPVGVGQAFFRELARCLNSLVFGLPIGCLWPRWHKKRQTWADIVMSTYVVTVPRR